MVVGNKHLGLGCIVAHFVDPAAVFVVAAVALEAVIGIANNARAEVAVEHKG